MQTERDDAAHQQWIGTAAEFDAFLARYNTSDFRHAIGVKLGGTTENIEEKIAIYFSEMRFGYAFVAERLPPCKHRILEVGAGLGLISIFLSSKGHDVTALEPSAPSFGVFAATQSVIWQDIQNTSPRLLTHGAEALTPAEHGTFDFIFSVNVMEHISALDHAFASVASVLATDGIWVNTCPNYIFPYEPHYAIPLIPFSQKLSRYVFAKTINKDPGVWDTLNFITSYQVKRFARKNGVTVTLEAQTVYKALKRLDEDAAFADRHSGGVVMGVYRLLKACRLLGLLKYVPARWVTPMVFTIKH